MRIVSVVVASLALVTIPSIAFADGTPQFGDAGTSTVTASFGVAEAHGHETASYSSGFATSDSTSLLGRATFDSFLVDGVSLGVAAGVDYVRNATHSEGSGTNASYASHSVLYQGALRVGYAFPVVDGVTFWPLASIGYAHASEVGVLNEQSSLHTWIVGAEAQLLFHVTPRFYLRFAPLAASYMITSVAGGGGPLSLSLDGGFGGWW